MNKDNTITRRNFTKKTLLASSAFILPGQALADGIFSSKNEFQTQLNISLFSKHLQFLDYTEMCSAVKEMGFDGIDLTVRPKGHVVPEKVEEQLPEATEVMKSFGLKPDLLSTNVIDVTNPIQRKVLETASQLGYRYYRPAWLKYSEDKDVNDTLGLAKNRFKALEELNKNLGISASYHNHSGHYFGSAIWDLELGLKGLSSEYIGSQYDIMHAHIEGGKNWEVGLRLIRPYINTLVVKDYKWVKRGDQWTTIYTPMGEGMVDFKHYFTLLKQSKINVPVSIHVEHDLGGAEHGVKPSIDKKEVFRRIKKDLDFVRRVWAEAS